METGITLKLSIPDLLSLEALVKHGLGDEDLALYDFEERDCLKALALKLGWGLLYTTEHCYLRLTERELWYLRDRLAIEDEASRKLKLKLYRALLSLPEGGVVTEKETVALNPRLLGWMEYRSGDWGKREDCYFAAKEARDGKDQTGEPEASAYQGTCENAGGETP